MKKLGRRAMAAFLALVMAASSAPFAMAGDTYPYVGESAKGENQPYQHGYRVEDITNWSPETDPYADLLRAEVPLQDRNAALAATQANPDLLPEAQYLTLTGDYGNAFFNSYSYTNEFSTHVFNFWQYVDYYASWHGQPSVGTPEELNDIEDERNATDGNAWTRRYFEFGLVNLPNPAYTNAAHKNGVLSLGCMFQPRAYQNFEEMLYTDENGRYPVADKLTEIAEYYGFDGYFFNMEGRSYSSDVRAELKKFLAQMRADGMYIQWYNAGSFSTDMLVDTETDTDIANSVFIEYGHSVPGDNATQPYGLDKFEVAFNGFEAGANRWSNDFSRMMSNGVMNGSIASLGTDFVQTGLEQIAYQDEETGYNLFTRELDEYQWMAFQRERLWWTGNSNNNTTVLNPGLTDGTSEIEARDFTGIADYIAERSVINGDAFTTNFNTGHGLEYVVDGQLSNEHEWSNINIQDILPTWQWWFETEGTQLSAEFDYGSKYRKVYNGGEEGSFGFDLVGAYNGGSSLAVYGALDAKNFMHLYKTDLEVKDGSQMQITFRKTSQDDASMKLGVILESNTNDVVELDIANTTAASEDWVTSTVDLSGLAGEKIAAFGLVFDGTSDDYQMNIGEMQYTSGTDYTPDAPQNLTVDKAYGNTNEMIVSWDMAKYDDVKQYNVYATINGEKMYMGGIYDNIYYIKDLYDAQGEVTIEVTAVGADGAESAPATVKYNYDSAVSNIQVDNSVDGQLSVTWDGGQADVTVTTSYEEEPRTWTASGDGSAVVEVPTGAEANGAAYTMTIETADGGFATYDGELPDTYCAPYDGRLWTDGRFTQPTASEWHVLYYQTVTDGVRSETDSYTRGVKSHGELNNDWSMFQPIDESVDGVYVWLEDYNGNKSEEVYVMGRMSVTVTTEASLIQAGGEPAQFTATVKNAAEDDSVTWSVSGNTSPDTTIDENGLLTVAADETAARLTVKAASNEDARFSGSISVTITPAMVLDPQSGEVYKGETQQITPENLGVDMGAENFTWSITSSVVEGTAIDQNGLLTIAGDETASTIRVQAASKTNENLVLTGSYTVRNAVSVSKDKSGPVFTGNTASYTASYKGEAADASEFNWSVSGNSSEGTTIENGVLTVAQDETATQVTITVTRKANESQTASVTTTVKETLIGDVAQGATVLGSSDSGDLSAMFDGDEETGWEADYWGSDGTGWVAIDLGDTYTVNRWKLVSPGSGDSANKQFALEVLKNPDATEEELSDASYLANDDNWTVVEFVDNSENAAQTVNRPLAELVTGRYFRLRVDEGMSMWGWYSYWGVNELEIFEGDEIIEIEVNDVTVSGPEEAYYGMTSQYDAVVSTSNGDEKAVTWNVSGNTSEGTTIDENGLLTVAEDEAAATLTVTATSVRDNTKSASMEVAVTKYVGPLPLTFVEASADGSAYEHKTMVADGDPATKWCAMDETGWAVVRTDKPVTIDRWGVILGEYADDIPDNAAEFALEVLKDPNATEEQLSDPSYLGNNDNWTEVQFVDNSNADKVPSYDEPNRGEYYSDLETAVTGQYFRLRIDDNCVANSNRAIRVHEIYLYEQQEAQVDKAALEAAVADAAQYQEAGYTEATWNVFAQAYADAQAVLADGAASQEDVDAAVTALAEAVAQLEEYVAPDKSVLQAAYDYAAAQDTSKLIESVKAMYDAALANAEAVLADAKATAEEVDAALDDLFEAVWSLGFVQGDKTTLGLLIERAESMDESKYVADNWQQLVDALANAKAVYEDGDAMDEDIQPLAEALLNAILAQRYKADKSILEEIINQANGIDTALYTAESVQAFTAALKAANAVLEDASLSVDEQEAVDAVTVELKTAMDNLVEASANESTDTGDDANKDDAASTQDPNKGPMDDSNNPATGDTTFALAALALLLTSAGAFVVIRRKNRA